MSKTIQITSPAQFSGLIHSSNIVVADFYADWCGPCKAIAPLYERLSIELSRPNKISFTKINTDQQTQIAQSYNVSAMPTFLVFRGGQIVDRIQGADPAKLSAAVKKLAAEAESMGPSSNTAAYWLGAELPRAYIDITGEVDVRGLDALNVDADFGTPRALFDASPPASLDQAMGPSGTANKDSKKDWVESDTDDQLMLYLPFMSTLKLHGLHITSLAPTGDDEAPMRPKQLKLFINRPHTLGFEEADDMQATQDIDLQDKDWDEKTGTARIELRFVKFQNITSLILYVVNGHGSGEKVRIDRLRLVGETGTKRDQGKLEKISHD